MKSDFTGGFAGHGSHAPAGAGADGHIRRKKVLRRAVEGCRIEPLEGRMLLSAAPTSQNVTTYHNDLSRTGQDLNETVLTPSNVNQNSFGKLFTDTVDGQVYTQPLYMASLSMPDGKLHNVVYVATEHDSVYAFDADAPGAPLWKDSFINPAAGITTVPSTDVGTGDISPEIGITGSPVIDPTTNTLYVLAKAKEVTSGVTKYVQRLHALDITTGAEKFGGPVAISASVPGTGAGAVNGKVSFDPFRNNERSALALVNGAVYICWAAHGDNGTYHGWVIGYSASTLQQTFAYCSSPNGSEAGIWMAGGAPAADASGNIYVSVGNGTVGDGSDFGESLLKLNPNATNPVDFFTPYNADALNSNDRDFGSGAVLLVPSQGAGQPNEIVTGGKEGRLYLLNRDTLGHTGTGVVVNGQTVDNNAIAEFTDVGKDFDNAAYFNGQVYVAPVMDYLRSYSVGNGTMTLSQSGPFTAAFPGGQISISANGSSNAILWELEFGTHSVLRAFNPANIDQEYYDSNQAGARDQLDSGVKFAMPTVANGHVYAGTADSLTVFGLAPAGQTAPAAPSGLSAVAAGPNEVKLAWTDNANNELTFSIERSTNNVNFTYLGSAPSGTNSFADTDATEGTTYYYRVRAANFVSSAPSNVASAATGTVANLVGYWQLDEGLGPTTADGSGNGNTGTLSGEVTWSPGLVGASALNFHGQGVADAHVGVTDNPSLRFTAAQSFTLGAWVRINSLKEKWAGIVTKSTDLGNGYGIYLDPSDKWAFATGSNTNVLEGPLATKATPYNSFAGWTYVTAVQNGAANTRTLYINGSAVATGTAFDASGTGDLWLGGSKGSINEYFDGEIDDVRLYNRALSAAEINALAKAQLPSPWQQSDVGGAPFGPGAANYANGVFFSTGSGDITGTNDGVHYVYQNFSTDGQIVAHVASQQNVGANAKAGVMIRQTIGGTSVSASVVVTPGQGVQFIRRTVGSAADAVTTVASVVAPCWVKLVRAGSSYSGYYSLDGKAWVLIGTDTITTSGSLLIGLAATSGSTLSLGNATFDNVTVSVAGNGTGLLGSYFATPTFSSIKQSRTDAGVNFNWATTPDASVGSSNFSVRWTGQVQPLYTETYTFFVTAADGVRLWVNNQLLIDDLTDHAAATQRSASIALFGGQKYDIRLDYNDHTDPPSVLLEWASNSQLRQAVPVKQLSLSTGVIAGTVFTDSNSNGTRDAGELGLSGWTVYLDQNNNGVLDAGEQSTTTDANGGYYFITAPGSYTVREVVQSGSAQTGPAGGFYSVTLVAGASVATRDFGDISSSGSTSGTVYNDSNQNGTRDSGEAGLSGWTVFIDQNNNGTFDSGEPSALTDVNGAYSFAGLAPGSYTLREVVQANWTQTAPAGGSYSVVISAGSNITARDFGNANVADKTAPTASLTTAADVTTSGLPSYTFTVTYNDNIAVKASTVGNGDLVVSGPGGYSQPAVLVSSGLTNGATVIATYAVPVPSLNGTYTITLQAGQVADTSGNAAAAGTLGVFHVNLAGSIAGTVYNDANENHQRDAGEGGVGSATVFLDANNNGTLEAGETSTTTAADGTYSFSSLPVGTYTVRTVLPGGYIAKFPAGRIVPLIAGQNAASTDFGITQAGSISGNVLGDTNGNGTADAGETGLSGITVYLDANNNGTLDSGETSTTTDSSGNFTFSNLSPGSYVVQEVLPANLAITNPVAGSASVTVTGGQITSGVSFADAPAASISGTFYNDANSNGTFDAGDTTLAGWEVYVDTNNDGVYSTGEIFALTNSLGQYTMSGLAPGTYRLREVREGGWNRTEPVGNWPAGFHDVTVTAGQAANGQNFGNTPLPDSISGFVYQDVNHDGVFDPGDVGLTNWTVFLDTNNNGILDPGESTAANDPSGSWSFNGLADGTYHVREIVQSGWTATTPAGGEMDVTLPANGAIVNFANTPSAASSISGTIFNDANSNGSQDGGENGLSGWTVYLDTNSNGALDSGEPTAISGVNGNYTFSNLAAGTYRVGMVTPIGWHTTTAAQPPITLALAQSASAINFGAAQDATASISGYAFNDLNNAGGFVVGDPSLSGWTVYIDANNNGSLDAGETSTTTDANGNFSFSNLTPGTYVLREIAQSGWQPSVSPTSVTVNSVGQFVTGVQFGNVLPVNLSGSVFNDLNGNGAVDSGETGLSGWQVFIDSNKNGSLDSGEPSTLTAADGSFSFANLLPGTYRLRVVPQAQWSDTTPAGGFVDALVQSGRTPGSVLFGQTHIQLGGINGNVFNDADANGTQDAGDNGISGRTVFIDANANGILDAGETSTTTNASGNYSFTGLAAGTYRIDTVVPNGWQLTSPLAGFASITLSSGQSAQANFGTVQLGSISGSVYNDANGNGARDTGETGLSGRSVFIDTNKNGSLDTGEPSTTTDVNGNFSFANLLPGTYQVTVVVPAGWHATAPASSFVSVALAEGQALAAGAFGEAQTLAQPGTITGSVFNDHNANGIKDGTDAGISGRTVFIDANLNGTLDAGETSTTTDASGNFSFSGLQPATYRIVAVNPANWQTTIPAAGFANVNVAAGQTISAGSFGSVHLSAISGTFFNDVNSNGLLDTGEVGLSGQTLFLDTNNNASLDTGEVSVTTDAGGNFSFTGLIPATYHVRAIMPNAFNPTVPATGEKDFTLFSGQLTSGNLFGAVQIQASTGTISGVVYNDANANGTQDAGDTGIAGRTVFIDANGNGVLDASESSTTTDSGGNYSFTGLAVATYRIDTVLPAGWQQTAPAAGFASIALSSGQSAQANLGTVQLGSISGSVYNDLNANGTQDSGETGLSGRSVFIDTNKNGSFDTGEPSTTTDVNGNFSFSNLLPGTYQVTVVVPGGWHATVPASSFVSAVLSEGQSLSAGVFGQVQIQGQPATITGSVFNDHNANGIKDGTTDGVLSGRTVFIDANLNGTLDAGETSTLTDANGNFSFGNLQPGTYRINAINPANWKTTIPVAGSVDVTVASGQTLSAGSFGSVHLATITGTFFNDANSNGLLDTGEVGLGGQTLFLDTNNNGALDAGETSVTTDTSGKFTFSGLVPGTYHVRAIMPGGFHPTVPSTGEKDFTLFAGQMTSGNLFGAAQTQTGAATIRGIVYNDINGNGLRDTATDAGISGRTVYIDSNNNGKFDAGEPTTLTDSGGNYSFSGLAAGTYKVRALGASGWRQTRPAGGSGLSITVAAGQNLGGQNFGFTQLALISGTIFNDANGNKIKDSGEAPLANWRIYVDKNNNGVFDTGEASVLTGSSGAWSFALAAGTYTIRAVPQAGWSQTLPTGGLGVVLTSGATVTSGLFGEKHS